MKNAYLKNTDWIIGKFKNSLNKFLKNLLKNY